MTAFLGLVLFGSILGFLVVLGAVAELVRRIGVERTARALRLPPIQDHEL